MKCGYSPKNGGKYCPNCGTAVEAGQIVCIKCGGSLAADGTSVQLGDVSEKEKVVYLVLALLIGTLGIHNFYAGYTNKGVIQLLVSLVSCGIFAPFVAIWAIVEALTVDKDAAGLPFKR